MTRRSIVWIGLVSLAAAIVLNTSLKTRQQQDHLAEINREIRAEEERIRVLTAEWHSLKTPERLEALARRHLQGYDTIKPLQLAALSDVPDRLPETIQPMEIHLAATAPAPAVEAAEAPRQVAAIQPPRPRPATRPVAAPPAQNRESDGVAALIAQAEAPVQPQGRAAREDGIRLLIERQPQQGLIRASVDGAQ